MTKIHTRLYLSWYWFYSCLYLILIRSLSLDSIQSFPLLFYQYFYFSYDLFSILHSPFSFASVSTEDFSLDTLQHIRQLLSNKIKVQSNAIKPNYCNTVSLNRSAIFRIVFFCKKFCKNVYLKSRKKLSIRF